MTWNDEGDIKVDIPDTATLWHNQKYIQVQCSEGTWRCEDK